MANLDLIRYKYDDPREIKDKKIIIDQKQNALKDAALKTLLSSSIRVSKELFPSIANSIENVFKRLKIENKFSFFVTANHVESQAYCSVMPQSDSAEIVLTSKIIELLTPNELEYVIGHEVAHFYFQHSLYPLPSQAKNKIAYLNALNLSRSAEVSADRVGYIAADHLDHSLRAILKLASGLGEQHIQFNYEKYLDQLKEIQSLKGEMGEILSTHPSFLNRVQALTWFSESKEYQTLFKNNSNGKYYLNEIDDKIYDSIQSVTGKELQVSNSEIFNRCVMWGALHLCLIDKKFSKEEQAKFTEKFGDQAKISIISLLKISEPGIVFDRVKEYFYEARSLPLREQEKIILEIKEFLFYIEGDKNKIKEELLSLEKLLNIN